MKPIYVFLTLLLYALNLSTLSGADRVPPEASAEVQGLGLTVSVDETLVDSLKVDDSVVERKYFPENFRDRYSGEKYVYEQGVSSEGWFTRFKNWLGRLSKKLFGIESDIKANQVADTIIKSFYVLISLAVVYIIVKLLMNKEGRWVFGKSLDRAVVRAEDVENNIHGTDFRALVQEAVGRGDYRTAIRYYYLWLLKELTNRGHIDYDVEKTNSDYLSEIQNGELKSGFGYASYLYNYIWYGEFDLEKDNFGKAAGNFDQLLNQLAR